MAARDDFPLLAALAVATLREPEYERALDEIDAMREMVDAARSLCIRWLDEGPDQLDSLDAVDRICTALLVDVD